VVWSFAKQRKKIIPLATGNVLEIGIGTGLNLPLYDNKRVIRPQLTLLKILGRNVPLMIKKARIYFKFMIASAEELPFDDGGFDTVVVTYSLCTIPDAKKGIRRNEKS
jgi:ubiquinone/menaquinone biosynthesis C-methylase UbiE